ncbi:MAG: CdaR family protein [Bacillota bacterium]
MERWWEKDLTVKVLSAVLALVIWFQVMSEENPAVDREFERIPIILENLREGYTITNFEPKSVNIVVRGQRRLVTDLDRADIRASVDLQQAAEGSETLRVEVSVPKGLTVLEVVPSLVTVGLDAITQREAKVKLEVMGTPAEDYVAQAPVAALQEVTVTGPSRKVAQIEYVLGRVDVTGAAGEITVNVPLVPTSTQGKEVTGVTLSPAEVAVTVPFNKLPPSKYLVVEPRITGVPEEGFRVVSVDVEPKTVKIRAPESVGRTLQTIQTMPLSVQGAASTIVRQMDLVVPKGLTSIDTQKVTVTVHIEEDIIKRTFDSIPILIQGVSPGLKWEMNPAGASVTVEGLRKIVEETRASEIELFVDASGLRTGEYSLNVKYRTPAGISVKTIDPATVDVMLYPRN